MEDTIAAGIALAENGADLIEIGIPYSDPVMDGQVIQAATTEALAKGFHVRQVFDVVAGITSKTDAAVLVMTYWNPVVRMGVDEFSRRLAEAGGAGLITPDLIPDEAPNGWRPRTSTAWTGCSSWRRPPSPERMRRTVEASRGFVYAVSIMGVTGARTSVSAAAKDVVAAAHAAGAERVCVGLGVSNAEQVREIAAYADGVIVGTALVAAIRDGGVDAVADLTKDLSTGLAREVSLSHADTPPRGRAMVPASIPSPDWSGFDIPLPWGTLRIHAYALCILAGIIVGLWLTSVRWARRGAPEGSVWDIAIWAIPFGIIGGRLYHVVSSPDAYFGPGFDGTGDLSLIPQIQRGGLGIWGAVVLGVVGAWIGCRRAGVKLSAFLDAAAPGPAAGPGRRPVGELLQPGTLRRPHHAAVGTADRRRQPELPGRHAGGHALPPHVPVRVALEPGRRADPAGPGPQVPLPPRPPVLALRHVLHAGPGLDRSHADRRGRADQPLRHHHPAQRLDQHLRVPRRPWRCSSCWAGARPEPDTAYLPGREPAADATAEAEGGTPAGAPAAGSRCRATAPRTPAPLRVKGHPPFGPAVSDSESRDNLPDNQSGPANFCPNGSSRTGVHRRQQARQRKRRTTGKSGAHKTPEPRRRLTAPS